MNKRANHTQVTKRKKDQTVYILAIGVFSAGCLFSFGLLASLLVNVQATATQETHMVQQAITPDSVDPNAVAIIQIEDYKWQPIKNNEMPQVAESEFPNVLENLPVIAQYPQ